MSKKPPMSALNIYEHPFATVSWQEKGALNKDRFLNLLRLNQGSLLRGKGWVQFDDTPEVFTLVQMVGNRIELTDEEPKSVERQNGLTFIILPDAIGPQAFSDAVSKCR